MASTPALREELTQADRDLLNLLLRHLMGARERKVTGRMTLELDLQDGSVTAKWVTLKAKEK
jgi:hypothetical protein